MKALCIVLVALGAGVMLYSIIQYCVTLRELRNKTTKSGGRFGHWINFACLLLMSFFLIGYIIVIVLDAMSDEAGMQNLLIASIFFFGAIFVLAVVKMIGQMMNTISSKDELAARLRQQELMSEISQSFLSTENVKVLIESALQKVGNFLDIDKLVIGVLDSESDKLDIRYFWYNEQHIVLAPEPNAYMEFAEGTVLNNFLIKKKSPHIICGDTENDAEFSFMKNFGVDSFIITPLYLFGEFYGMLSIDECRGKREWSAGDVHLASLISSVISELLSRARTEEYLRLEKEKAENASKAKSDFLSRMSHEMRTPMNAIIGMTSIAKGSSDVTQKEYCLSRIEMASSHLLGVINDVLDMSKIEADKFELSYTDFCLQKMLAKVVNVTKFRSDEKKQDFTVTVSDGVPDAIISDEQRLAQVITNLLSNSVKFTPDGGKISLEVECEPAGGGGYTMRFKVSDTGIGMTAEQCSRLFRSFEQADGSTSRKFGGTGLGLAISKRIAMMLGGDITVASEVGRGSTFTLCFPTKAGSADCTDMQTNETEGGETAGAFAGKRLLLAEDVDINREILATLLEPTAISIDFAENGKRAVDMFAKNPDKYDIILMDIQMPEMNGYDATRRIRKLPVENAKSVPIYAMTANVFKEDIDKCLEAGMNGHLGKPIDIDEVLYILKKTLN